VTFFPGNLDDRAQQHAGEYAQSALVYRASIFALAFVGLCILVAFDATQTVDRWGLILADPFVSCPLDVIVSLVTFLGEPHITGGVAVLLSLVWWQSRGLQQGLAPLLLFVGVAIEVVLKCLLPHPGPAHEFSRDLYARSTKMWSGR
jgi:hypothetical protein